MLFRFRESQAAELGIIDAGRTRRPKMITEVNAIPACEKWRGQVLKEISRKSQDPGPSLSDFMIRDLNDEINKAMREKHMWEVQIRNLGGPNYMRSGRCMMKRERKYRAVGRVIGRFSGHPCLRENADRTPDILGERENSWC